MYRRDKEDKAFVQEKEDCWRRAKTMQEGGVYVLY